MYILSFIVIRTKRALTIFLCCTIILLSHLSWAKSGQRNKTLSHLLFRTNEQPFSIIVIFLSQQVVTREIGAYVYAYIGKLVHVVRLFHMQSF